MPMDRNTGKRIGIVTNIDQCIGDILRTPLGSAPMRPDYGIDLLLLADTPLNPVGVTTIKARTVGQVKRFETRPTYDRVSLSMLGSSGALNVGIEWSHADGEPRRTIAAPLPSADGSESTLAATLTTGLVG